MLREIPRVQWFTPQFATATLDGTGGSQGAGCSSGCRMCVIGATVSGSVSPVFPRPGRSIRLRAAETNTGVGMGC